MTISESIIIFLFTIIGILIISLAEFIMDYNHEINKMNQRIDKLMERNKQ